MKVTFVYPDMMPHVIDWSGYYHYGIGLLSAVLKTAGHTTSLIHVVKPIKKADFVEQVKNEKADLLAFSSTSHMFSQVRMFLGWLREEGVSVPSVCGGVHPTIAPEECIAVDGLDMICRGESEAAFLQLCNTIEQGGDITGIENVWAKQNGTIFRNAVRPVVENLDELPFPDRSVFDYRQLYNERQGIACFMASRGCPYSCTYCCNQLKRSISGTVGKPVRFRSVDNLLQEVKQVLQQNTFVRKLAFDDDILFVNKKWAEEFTSRYKKEIRLPFMCNARADRTDETVVNLLKEAGCYYVKIGVESGNQEIRYKVLNRRMTNQQIAKAFDLCKKAGMTSHAYNIVGIPEETPAAILDTIKLNAEIGVDITHVSIFQPYPGTKLEEMCRERNLFASHELSQDFCSSSILKLDTVSPSQVMMFRDYFRPIMKCYRMARRLPARVSTVVIKMVDRCLSYQITATLLNGIYVPCNFVYRRANFAAKMLLARYTS